MNLDGNPSRDESPQTGREPSPVLAVVHYHEIALKKRNRPLFVGRLVRNIEAAVSDLPVRRVVALPGRLLVELDDEDSWPALHERLAHTMGIANYARAQRAPLGIDAISEAVVKALEGKHFGSFRVTTRRANKKFPLNSMEIDRQVGRRVQAATDSQVDLSAPELTIFIEILPREAYFYFDKHPGSRGVPVGTGGRVVALLSGGIDSPVAAYRMMKRGCRVIFVHFSGVPFLSRASQQKAKELTEILNRYQHRSLLYLVEFGELQRQIMLTAPTALRVVIYRRFMLRIATQLAKRRRARAIVTGESLGQVASQTLENLSVIEQAADLPILRPLIGMDKEEIIAESKALKTYDVSILPDQDCCQLFIPTHPATRSRLWEVEAIEKTLDIGKMVDAAAREAEKIEFVFP